MSKRRKSEPLPKWFPFFFLLIGLFFLTLTGTLWYNNMRFNERAQIAEGVVIQMIGGKQPAPVVRFRLPNGEGVTFQSSLSSKPPRYEVEEKVKVRYDPTDPTSAAIVGWMEEWFAIALMGGFGVIFSAVGSGLLFLLKP